MQRSEKPGARTTPKQRIRQAASQLGGEAINGVTLRGTVLDAKTGKPIAEAIIEWGSLFGETTDRERALTDARGHYVLHPAQGGPTYRLGVHAPGYAPQWLDLGLIATAKTHVHDFQLVPGQRASDLLI